MENTCLGDKCAFLQSGIIKSREECPNFMETLWSVEGEHTPRLILDCAPKRQIIMLQEIHNRLFAVQKTQTEQRNAGLALADAIRQSAKDSTGELSDAGTKTLLN